MRVWVEEPLGVWTQHIMTPESRRVLFQTVRAEHRFVHEGIFYLTHANNPEWPAEELYERP